MSQEQQQTPRAALDAAIEHLLQAAEDALYNDPYPDVRLDLITRAVECHLRAMGDERHGVVGRASELRALAAAYLERAFRVRLVGRLSDGY